MAFLVLTGVQGIASMAPFPEDPPREFTIDPGDLVIFPEGDDSRIGDPQGGWRSIGRL